MANKLPLTQISDKHLIEVCRMIVCPHIDNYPDTDYKVRHDTDKGDCCSSVVVSIDNDWYKETVRIGYHTGTVWMPEKKNARIGPEVYDFLRLHYDIPNKFSLPIDEKVLASEINRAAFLGVPASRHEAVRALVLKYHTAIEKPVSLGADYFYDSDKWEQVSANYEDEDFIVYREVGMKKRQTIWVRVHKSGYVGVFINEIQFLMTATTVQKLEGLINLIHT